MVVLAATFVLFAAGCRKDGSQVFGFGKDGIQLPYKATLVGSEKCGFCHSDHSQWQQTSHMARTGRAVTAENRQEWFSDARLAEPIRRPLSATRSVPAYRSAADGVYLSAANDSAGVRVEAIFGSGAHGFTPIGRAAGPAVLELSISSLSGSWIPTPGQHNALASLGVTMPAEEGERCLGCHMTSLAWVEEGLDREGSVFGVQCERCHGPGSAHVEAILEGDEDRHIFNPGHLPANKQVEFCGQCHRKSLDLDPEQILNDAASSGRHAGATLMLSACFREAAGETISCLDCHNPHKNIEAATDPFNDACLSCHSSPATLHSTSVIESTSDCVACHMRQTSGLGGITFTNHWIRTSEQEQITGADRQRLVTHMDSVYQEGLLNQSMGSLARADLLVRRAQTAALLSRTDEALQLYTQALAIGPRYSVLLKMASDLDRLGHTAKAIDVLETAAPMEPRRNDAYRELRELHTAHGEQALADEVVDHWSTMLPGDRDLGRVLISEGNFDRAEAHFLQAVDVDPGGAGALLQLGNISRLRGNLSHAVEMYRQSIQLAPDYAEAHIKLGQALVRQGNQEAAAESLRRGLELYPESATAHADLGLLLAQQQEYDTAAAHFSRALAIDSTLAKAHWGMGRVREFQGQLAEAIEHYRASMRSQANPEVMSRLAWILATAEDRTLRNGSEAVKIARRLADLSGYKDPVVLNILAAAFTEVGAQRSAGSIARRALNLVASDTTASTVRLRGALESYLPEQDQ